MSLSSSGERVAALVKDSLSRLALQHPDGYASFVDALGAERVLIAIPPERFVISVEANRARIAGEEVVEATSEVVTDRRTVDDVIGGRLSLVQAVEFGRLQITGSIDGIAVMYQALITYVFAMADIPAHVDLVDRFNAR